MLLYYINLFTYIAIISYLAYTFIPLRLILYNPESLLFLGVDETLLAHIFSVVVSLYGGDEMASMYVRTSGDFDKLDPVDRFEARQELFDFLEREKGRYRELHLHMHLKRLRSMLGNNPLLQVSLNLRTNKGSFHVMEEGFGLEAAVKSALLSLRYQVTKQREIMMDARMRVEGRRAFHAET